jgi:hypothetical protein
MAQRLFVTIGSRMRKDRVLLEMPGDAPVREWMGDLIRTVGWQGTEAADPGVYHLETEEGERLEAEETLLGAGITSSDLLFLEPGDGAAEAAGPRQEQAAPAGEEAGFSLDELGRTPRLTGPQGLVILLGEPPLAIGRAGKASRPDIDLSEWDSKVIASRKHAVLEKDGIGFSLRPEKTTNGTFINGVEVPAGESRPLNHGDRIQFGFGGLELVYRISM